MSELTITGTIQKFLSPESGVAKTSGNEWHKQSFIVVNNDGYEGKEQLFCFEVFGQEKVENLTKFQKVGDEVKVQFNISINEWKDRYFTSLGAWRIEKVAQDETQPEEPKSLIETEESHLPF